MTPLMDKIYKSTLDEASPDEWLYGEKFSDQVEDAKVLEKTSASIKASDKSAEISSYFLVPKPDVSKRFIFNLKKLNKYVQLTHLKMKGIRFAKNLITKDT